VTKGFFVKQIMYRLRQWAEIQAVRPIKEAADVTGGRDAELLLKQLIGSSQAFKDGQVFAGRRIPSKRQGRRREIDLIVCTPRMIHLIEVKNWSGRLEIFNGRWHQNRRSGDVVDHGDLIKINLQKQDAVVEYLHDRGISIDNSLVRDHIVTEIIFMNRKLELDPAIEALPEIITRRELDQHLGRQPRSAFVEQMFSTLIELCLSAESKRDRKGRGVDREPIPTVKFQQITKCLAETMTWDRLHFYGTKTVTGDVVRLQLGLNTYRKHELLELAGHDPIRLWWTRNRLWGFLKAVLGLGPLGQVYLGKSPTVIEHADTVSFHAVGEEEPRTHRLVELDQIVLG
jgi:Nuclease-related domain